MNRDQIQYEISEILNRRVHVELREDLVGKYYHCIFDEKNQKVDWNYPHYHLISRAVEVYNNDPDVYDPIWKGIALAIDGEGVCSYLNGKIHNWHFNVKEKYIKEDRTNG